MKRKAPGENITFDSLKLLLQIFTPECWNIIRTMTGARPLSIRQIAQRLARNDTTIQNGVHALLDAGVIDRDAGGAIEFPYNAVHVDFMISAEGAALDTPWCICNAWQSRIPYGLRAIHPPPGTRQLHFW